MLSLQGDRKVGLPSRACGQRRGRRSEVSRGRPPSRLRTSAESAVAALEVNREMRRDVSSAETRNDRVTRSTKWSTEGVAKRFKVIKYAEALVVMWFNLIKYLTRV